MTLSLLRARFGNGKRGFTLVELLVVIAIIGILAVLLLLQFGTVRSKARDTKRLSDINNIRTGMELYFDTNTDYPATILALETAGILTSEPDDPTDAASYHYHRESASEYMVWAELENSSTALNSDADIDGSGWTGVTPEAGVNGGGDGAANEACTSRATCIFDLGQN